MKTIIEMAREAGGDDWGLFKDFMPEIERLVALVRADEREACAKVCEHEWSNAAEREFGDQCAAIIRGREARGNT
jgi:hypothetical protein